MKTPMVILHGWAKDMTGAKYTELKQLLEKKGYEVFVPDLPGFGANPLDKVALQFHDYIDFTHHYIESVLRKTKQKKVILLGHSFGGRVAIRFTSLYPQYIETLVLTGASGIPRPLPSVKKKVIYSMTKLVRPLFIIPPFSLFYRFFRKAVYYSIGEMDYYKAGNLTQTFKNVYKISIVSDLEKITVPTLLVWAENDKAIPIADGEFMHKHISGSKFVIITDATHRLPYEKPKEFCEAILSNI